MERKSSLGRYSLSTTNITIPIAESTHINSSTLQPRFQWGSSPISSANKTAANVSLTNGNVSQQRPQKVAISPINKIDPRVYTDVQSKGLVSRIVKYHEHSTKLNRSQSATNLYTKPGEYPIVHLKKKEIHCKPSRYQSGSIGRIAPPEKSIYHGNTLSSILRAGATSSSFGLKKPNEDDSHENRPILHPPPTENDMAPTRSVLEVLKEISRKRIISDDVDGVESTKKYCKEPDLETTYTHNTASTSNYNNSVIAKRQREVPSSPNSKQSTSPEQVVKKRMCSRNNDILSSLSSSLVLITPKRKKQHASSTNPSPESPHNCQPPQAKQLRNESNYPDLTKLPHSFHGDPITPLPPTPAVDTSIRNVEPHRTASEPIFASTAKVEHRNRPTISNKPKLTLFNTDYEPNIMRRPVSEEKSDSEGLSKIQFIKPKKSSSISSVNNPLIERAQKSKLALMLSGLKGELDETDGDQPVEVTATTQASLSFGTSTIAVTNTIPSPTITSKSVSSEKAKETPVSAVVPIPSISLSTKPMGTISAATTTSASLVGFKFGSTTSPTAITAAVASTTSTAAGFSFGTKTTISSASTAASSELKPSLSFGSPVVVSSTAIIVPAAAPILSIAANPVQPTATSLGSFTSLSNPPQFGLGSSGSITFSTGSTLGTATTNGSVSATATTTALPTFGSISAPTTKATLPTFGSISAPATTAAILTFGSISAPTTTSALPTFGSISAPTTMAALPTFGIISAPTTTAALPTFGSISAPKANAVPNFGTTTSTIPSFGNSNVTSTSTPALSFGSGATSALGSTPSFGSLNAQSIPTVGLTSAPTFGSLNTSTPTFGQSSANLSKPKDSVTAAPVFGSVSKSLFGAPATTSATGNVASPVNTGAFSFGEGMKSTNSSSTNTSGFSAVKVSTDIPSGGFSFSTNVEPSSKSTNQFAFGGAATTTPAGSTFAFPSANSTNQPTAQAGGFSFGGSTTSVPTTQTSSVFGGSSTTAIAKPTTFAFGGSVQTAAPSEAFSFQTTKPAAAEVPSMAGGFSFNSSTLNGEIKNMNGSVKSDAFSFGGNSTVASKPPIFGAAAPQSSTNLFSQSSEPNKTFSFGASTPANNNITQSSNNLFGKAPSDQSNSFSFGSQTATPTQSATNLFASPPVSAAPSAFGAPSLVAKPATQSFSFGGNTNNNTFAFGSAPSAANTQTAPAAQPFAFGSASAPKTNAEPTPNLFGNAPAKPASFNFSASGGGDTNSSSMFGTSQAAAAPTNMFNPLQSGPSERPIRRATRRLQK